MTSSQRMWRSGLPAGPKRATGAEVDFGCLWSSREKLATTDASAPRQQGQTGKPDRSKNASIASLGSARAHGQSPWIGNVTLAACTRENGVFFYLRGGTWLCAGLSNSVPRVFEKGRFLGLGRPEFATPGVRGRFPLGAPRGGAKFS